MHSFTDQLGNKIEINYPPKRIVSLVPSQTELLFDLGLDKEVVGITKFCVHPGSWFKEKIKVGGTKKLKLDMIRNLKPDLIIGNKEENTQSEIEMLQKEFPVWMSDIFNLDDALKTIKEIGALTGREPEAAYLGHLINAGFTDLATIAKNYPFYGKSVIYLIWRNPYMAAGRQTFINDILLHTGLRNTVEEVRYPEITLKTIADKQPDFIFLSSEPYPFKEKHLQEISSAVPGTKVILVDGEMFSWYGSRLVNAVQYLFEFQKMHL